MVKKTLNDNIGDVNLEDIDTNFNIDDIQFDDIDISGRDPSKADKKNIFSKIAKYIDIKSFSKSFISKVLPTEYNTTIDSINTNIDTAKALYDKTLNPVKDTLRRNNRTLKALSPYVDKVFGSKIGSKYRDKILEYTPYTSSNDNDTTENDVQSTLTEIFGEQQKITEEHREKDIAQQLIRDRREDLRFNKSYSISKGIYDVNRRLLDYHEQIDYKYKQKSMELKVRTYIEMRKYHMLTTVNMNETTKFLKQLVHNSSLPDIQKLKVSEQAKGMVRERLIGKAQAIPAEMASKYLNSIATNLGESLSNFSDTVISTTGDLLDGAEYINDPNMGGAASFIAPILSSILGSSAGSWVGKKTGITNSKTLKNALNKLSYISNNSSKIIASKIQNSTGYLGELAKLGNTESYNLTLRRDTLANSTDAAIFDNATRKSIVETIPGYLSLILQSVDSIRLGDQASKIVYDHSNNEFTSEDELVKRTANSFNNDSSLVNMQRKINDIISKLTSNKRVSGRAITAIKKELYYRLMKGEMFSPNKLANTDTYREKINPKLKKEIEQVFADYSDPDVMSKDFWTSDNNTTLLELDNLYNSAMSSHPDLVSRARMLDSVGQKDIVKKLGLLNTEGDIDLNKLINFYSGKGKVISNEQNTTRTTNSISTGRYGGGTNTNRNTIDDKGTINVDDSIHDESYQVLTEIRDAVASAQEVKNDILVVEKEIKDIVQSIRDFLPEINAVSYNISGDELSSKLYDNIRRDVTTKFNRFGSSIKRGSKSILNYAKKPTKWALSGISKTMDMFCDIYVKGRKEVALYATKLKEGKYFDQLTGKVIKKLSDIKGAVIDEDGNVVLTVEDIESGLFDYRGKKILLKAWGIVKNTGKWITDKITILNPLTHITRFGKAILSKVVNWWVDEAMDVYVIGETSPRLLKLIFKNHGYFSKLTGKVLTGADKIDGEVTDKDGNVILSNDDIKKGLVDKYGKPLKFGIAKYIQRSLGFAKSLLVKPILAAAKIAGKVGRGLYKGTAALGRFIFGSKFSESEADKALPSDASLEARYLNRIYYFLRRTFGGAMNGFFNKAYQGTRNVTGNATGIVGSIIGGVKNKYNLAKEMANRAKEKYTQNLKDKMETYEYKRWKKRVNDDNIADEENRKNSWRWKAKNKTKSVTPKQEKKEAEKKFGWLKFVLGGVAGLGWFLFKNLTKSIFKISKMITSGLGGLLKPILGSALSGVGSMALSAAKLGGRALGSVATWAGRGLISAAPAILSNPVGLTIAAVALVAVGGYIAYKWWSGRLRPLQKYRYAQYGADLENDDVVEQVAAAEKYFYDNLSFGSVGKPPVLSSDFDAKYFAQLCGCQLGDQNDQQTRWWCSWFDRRFVPVAMKWAMTMQEYKGTKPFYDADNLLDDEDKVAFSLKVGFDTSDLDCPYNLRGGPNPFFPTVVGNGVIMQLLRDIREDYYDDIPKTKRGEVKIDEALAIPIKTDAKLSTIDSISNVKEKDLKLDLSTNDHVMLIDKNNLNGIQLDEKIIKNQETSESATSFTWVRLLCYGLSPELMGKAKWVNRLLSLEYLLISEFISFRGGKVIFIGKTESGFIAEFSYYLRRRIRAIFGWSEDEDSDETKRYVPFIVRFLAVFGRYLALANDLCPGVNIFEVYKQPNNILHPLAKELATTHLGQGIQYPLMSSTLPREAFEPGTRWNIWDVTGEMVPGHQLNTDYKTVLTYLDALDPGRDKKTGILKDNKTDPATGQSAGDKFKSRYGINNSGISYNTLKNRYSNTTTNNSIDAGNAKVTFANRVELQPDANDTKSFSSMMSDINNISTNKSTIPPLLRNAGNADSGDPQYGLSEGIGKAGIVPPGALSDNGTFLPTSSNVVTSLFGTRKLPTEKRARPHRGIDLRARDGDEIRAFKDGVVITNWNDKGYGDFIIDHGNGFQTRYLHTRPETAKLISKGKSVKAGDLIAYAGGYGTIVDPVTKTKKQSVNAYQPHLHFETWENGQPVNPLKYLLASNFDLREKLDGGALARIDRPYTQQDKTSPSYNQSRKAIDRTIAGVDDSGISQMTASVNAPVKPNIPNDSFDNRNNMEVGNGPRNYENINDTSQYAHATNSIFTSGDSRIKELRNANNRNTEATLNDTNHILIDNVEINKQILNELVNMNSKMGELVDASKNVAKIIVGGKEINLKQTASDNNLNNNRSTNSNITRTSPVNPIISFDKRAV